MGYGRAEAVLEHILGQRQRLIDLLGRMVEAESPSTDPGSHRPMSSLIEARFDALDYRVRRVGGDGAATHLYARPSSRDRGMPVQLLVGHYDTVWPVGTIAERPFTVDGNVVRGPGVFDMKGGLAQMIFALEALDVLELEPPVMPIAFVNSDEEIGSRGSTRFIRSLAQCVDRAFVLEPAMDEAGIIKTERKGVGRFKITVRGKAAHAGLDPEGGASAILELSHVIQKLFALNDAERGISVNVGTVDGGLRPNIVAPYSQAVVDVRVPTIADGKQIEDVVYGLEPETTGVRLQVEGGIGRPSMERTPRNRALWHRAREIGTELGIDLEEGRAGGASDGNTTSQYTATLDGLGPVGHGAHAEHEFLYLDKTLERTALLVMLLLSPPVGGIS